MGVSFLEDIKTDELRKEYESASSRTVKRKWIKEGYSHQMSLYGVLTNRDDKTSERRRIEILGDVPFTKETILLIGQAFEYLKPPFKYTIWLFDSKNNGIRMVGSFD